MPSKKKKYNARFPPARIKKIMQTDEDVGKVAAAVPVIISRALEKFIETLIVRSSEITQARNAKTLTTSHIKQTVHNEKKFDFLKDLMATVPDHQAEEDSEKSGAQGETKRIKTTKPRKQQTKKEKRKRKSSDSSEEEDNGDEQEAEDDSETETDNEGESQEMQQDSDFSSGAPPFPSGAPQFPTGAPSFPSGPSSSSQSLGNIQSSSSSVTHSSNMTEAPVGMPQFTHPGMLMDQTRMMYHPAMSLPGPYPPGMGVMPLIPPQGPSQGPDGLHPMAMGGQDPSQYKNNMVKQGAQTTLCNNVAPYPPGMYPAMPGYPYLPPLPHTMGGQATYQAPTGISSQNVNMPFYNNGLEQSSSKKKDNECITEPNKPQVGQSKSDTSWTPETCANVLNLSMPVKKPVSQTSEDDDYDT